MLVCFSSVMCTFCVPSILRECVFFCEPRERDDCAMHICQLYILIILARQCRRYSTGLDPRAKNILKDR